MSRSIKKGPFCDLHLLKKSKQRPQRMIKDPSKLGRAGQRFFQILSVSPLRYIMAVSTFPSIFQKIWWAVNSASLCCPAPSKVILRIKKLKNRENHESECHSPQRPHFGAENAACRGSDPGFISRPRFEYARVLPPKGGWNCEESG